MDKSFQTDFYSGLFDYEEALELLMGEMYV